MPELTVRVNDYAGLLTGPEREALERKLAAYERRTGHQFALLTVETLDGAVLEVFSLKVARQWALGDRKRNDGLLFVLAKNERVTRIEVGIGLETAIPDQKAKAILDELGPKYFGRGAFAEGLDFAFGQLMKAAEDTAVRTSGSRLGRP